MQYILTSFDHTDNRLEFVNATALAKPDCLHCGYIHRLLNSTQSMYQEAFIKKSGCRLHRNWQKSASKKVPKLNSCDLGGDWDVVNSLR